MKIEYAPLTTWPLGYRTPASERRESKFRAGWNETLALLERELAWLGVDTDDRVVFEAGYQRNEIRRDGFPRRDARLTDPGLAINFTSIHGPLRYACDRYLTINDNLRAIALSLTALRDVERWGVLSRGEQYLGSAIPAVTETREQAEALIRSLAGPEYRTTTVIAAWRRAARLYHPDVPLRPGEPPDGRAKNWARLSDAKETLGL